MSPRWSAALVVACLGIGHGSAAGQAPRAVDHLNFSRLMPEDGLPAGAVYHILQDSRGFMWFATSDGLARYDGQQMTVFRAAPSVTADPASNVVFDAAEDRSGHLWLATDAGLWVWRRDTETFGRPPGWRPEPASPLDMPMRAVRLAPGGTAWIGLQRGGVVSFEPATSRIERYRDGPGGLSDGTILALVVDRSGAVWAGTRNGGLNRIDPAHRRVEAYRAQAGDRGSLPHDRVSAIALAGDGTLWVGTDAGVCRRPRGGTGFERLPAGPSEPGQPDQPTVESLWPSRDGSLWIGRDGGGLSRYDPVAGRFTSFRHVRADPLTIASDVVLSICEDRDGDIWAGSNPGSVSHASRITAAFRGIRTIPGAGDSEAIEEVWSFSEDPSGDLWVGTDANGLAWQQASTGRWSIFRNRPGDDRSLASNSVTALYRDWRGRLWVGAYRGGLHRFDQATRSFVRYPAEPQRPDGPGSSRIWRIAGDRQHRLWIATQDAGVDRLDETTGRFEHFRHDPADPFTLPNDNVLSLLVTRRGDVWAGTYRGLAKFDEATETWESVRRVADGAQHGLSHDFVVDLIEDQAGRIWIATQGGGVNRLDPDTGHIVAIRASGGLPSDLARGLLEDVEGAIWVSTSDGVARVDAQTLAVRAYFGRDGLPVSAFNRGARLRRASGALLFGGGGGYTAFDPTEVGVNAAPPPVVLTGFEVFNQPVTPGGPDGVLATAISEARTLSIASRYSVLSFRFAALSYRAPDRNRYAYMLEGFDPAWRMAGPERRATYTNLGRGRYRFRVRAANSDGVWNEEGVSLDLIVVPPFWRTAWFEAAASLGLLAGLASIVWFASNRRLRRRMQEAERERLLALERQHAEEALRQRDRQLQQAQKLESLGVLAGGIAHDFNNLLVAILGNADLALRDLPTLSPARTNIVEVEQAARRAADLCRQMLAYSGRGRLATERIRLAELVGETVHLLRSSVAKKADLVIDLDPHLPPIRGDATQIRQVVMNLVINASEAIGDGEGTITVSAGATQCRAGELGERETGEPMAAGLYVWLEVADTGCGMDEATVGRIFEPFFTTKFTGRGLGLSVVLGIVRGHAGALTVDSRPGGGTRFKVLIPAAEETDESGATAGPRASSLPTFSGVALLVDDEETVRTLGRRMLERLGFEVVTARDGFDALVAFMQHRDAVRLVLLDLTMARMDGEETLRRLRAIAPGVRVVLSTGYAESDVERRFEGLNLSGVLEKPYSLDELAERVSAALGNETQAPMAE